MEKLKCKVGDLAIFTGSNYNNGKIVKIISPWDDMNSSPINKIVSYVDGYNFKKIENKFCWIIESIGTPIDYGKDGDIVYKLPVGPGWDFTLTPLNPENISDEVIRKVELPATV